MDVSAYNLSDIARGELNKYMCSMNCGYLRRQVNECRLDSGLHLDVCTNLLACAQD